MYKAIKGSWNDIKYAFRGTEGFFAKFLFILRVINYFLFVIPLVIIFGFIIGILLFQNPYQLTVELLENLVG